MRYREDGCRILRGRGIEIGALHAPVRLSPGLEVEYCDVFDLETAAERFPELDPVMLVRPRYVFDIDKEGLAAFADASVDFVIANLVLAHIANPIKLLGEMLRVLRRAGHIVVSAADKRFTHDRDRDSSSFSSLLDLYRSGMTSIDDEFYKNMLSAVDIGALRGPVRKVDAALRRARDRREAIHVWNSMEFSDFLARSFDCLGVRAGCVFERNGNETGIEHFSIWRVAAPVRRLLVSSSNLAKNDVAEPVLVAADESHRIDQASANDMAGIECAKTARSEDEIRVAEGRGTRGVMLLGMHRSGTSVTARLLGDTGLWLGDAADFLLPHAEDNPDGYWERRDVYEAHADFLSDLGMDWDRLSGFSAKSLQQPKTDSVRKRLVPVLNKLRSHSPWLIKDPRLGLMLPVWDSIGADFVPVVVVRHPLEIAGSLSKSPRGIFPTAHLLALWEKYLLRTLAGLAGRRAIFVSYRRLLESPHGAVARLVGLLKADGVDGLKIPPAAELQKRVKSGLYRQRVDGDPGGLMTHAQTLLWRELCAAAEMDRSCSLVLDNDEPDATLALYEEAYDSRIAIGRHLAIGEQQIDLAAIRSATSEILEHVRAQNDWLYQENEDLRQRQADQDAVVYDLRQRLDQATANSRRLQADVEEIARREQDGLKQIRAHGQALMDMRRSLSWRITFPLRWLAGLIRLPRMSYRMEQRLYRWYYGIPAVSYRRKRQFILWLHRVLPWLTRSTQSYTLFQHGTTRIGSGPKHPRMDAPRAAKLIQGMKYKPKISIIMPVHNTDRRWLHDAIESLRAQYYENWELCLVDDCSSKPETLEYLAQLNDPRVCQRRMETNQGIARTTNAALALATGEYFGLLDHDDVLTRDALLETALVFQDRDVDLVYSDEDKMDVDGNCHGPVHKPDYSPDYLLSNNYFCHFTAFSRELVEAVGGLHYGYDGAQDFDLVLRLTERARNVRHIPKVLYHWRMVPSSTAATAGAKPYTWEAGRRALTDALQRRAIAGHVDLGPYPNTYHVRRDLLGEPQVSIVVPFRDEPKLLKQCVASVLERSSWSRFELVLVDNQSRLPETADLLRALQACDGRIRVLRYDQPFNYSALHNWVVPQLAGELLLLLNNDTQVISSDWIESLIEHAQRPEVGVVGCRLLYPDDTVQHAGVIVGIGSFAGHAHHLVPADHPGYMARPHLLQNVSAVTFACAMMRTAVYAELGGMDAANLAVAYNDVDFCLRAREKGYLVVYTPHAELYHYESHTRGGEDEMAKRQRFAMESAYMHHRHRAVVENGDPFYNVNFERSGNSFEIDPDYVATLPL